MEQYIKRQGNALFVKITCVDALIIDPNWSNWSGTWGIYTAIGEVATLSGNLVKSDIFGDFYLKLGPNVTGWSNLPIGKYVLLTEIVNPTAGFLVEDEDKLKITRQGM